MDVTAKLLTHVEKEFDTYTSYNILSFHVKSIYIYACHARERVTEKWKFEE
jgi:hypothetical protein